MVRKQRARARSSSAQVKTQICNVDLLQRALAWIVRGEIFEHLPKHGNTSWLPTQLIVLAILWVWSDQSQLTKAYEEGRQAALKFYAGLTLESYQGFIRALTSWTEQLRPLLWLRLQQLMEQVAGVYWCCGEFVVLAVDGSRVSVPRTKSNEQAFAAKNYGQGTKARSRRKWKNKKRRSKKLGSPVKPQIWLTMIWHVGLKMPWCWRTGPSTSSERGHFLDLLKSCVFPQKTLFCADAGFVGYELWKAIVDAGHDFLIRVGGNIVLLRKLGRVRVERDIVFTGSFEEVNEFFLGDKNPTLLVIPPLVMHGMKGIGVEPAYLVNVPTYHYDYKDPDEHRVPAHDPSIPYDWSRHDG